MTFLAVETELESENYLGKPVFLWFLQFSPRSVSLVNRFPHPPQQKGLDTEFISRIAIHELDNKEFTQSHLYV